MLNKKKGGEWEWNSLPLSGCMFYMGRNPQSELCPGLAEEGWRGVCLHPAAATERGRGSTNHSWGVGRQPEIHPHSQHDFRSFILPENQPKNRLGRVQGAGVSFCTHLCRAAAKAIFLQVGARNQVPVVLVQRGEDWLEATVTCSVELVGNGSLGLSCTQKCRSWRVRHGCACGCSTSVIYWSLRVLVVLFLRSGVVI